MDSTMAVAQRRTLAEYVARDDLPRWTNLVDGEVVVSQPTWLHQRVLMKLAELARGDTLKSPLLSGFALALDELFGPLGATA